MTNHPNRSRHTRRYYAAQSPRGFANEILVHVFGSRQDRDAWVAAHADDGDANSAAQGARAITRQSARAILGYRGDAATQSYIWAIEHRKGMTIHEILNEGTDWQLIAQQKLSLVRLLNGEAAIPADDRRNLDGILNWIDALQDAAEREGYPVVFLSEDRA